MLQPVKDVFAICNVMKFLGVGEDTVSVCNIRVNIATFKCRN